MKGKKSLGSFPYQLRGDLCDLSPDRLYPVLSEDPLDLVSSPLDEGL
jgi:hypothetical protein